MSTQPLVDQDLDTIQHPIYGTLKFPKTMPGAERNQIIDSLAPAGSPKGGPPIPAGHPPANLQPSSASDTFLGGARNVASRVGSNLKGMAQPFMQSPSTTLENITSHQGSIMRGERQPDVLSNFSDTYSHDKPLAFENLAGDAATAELTRRAGNAIPKAGTALRSAAIGDPDAAALKALNVSPKSGRVQSTLNAVERTRPYVAGAKNLQDLQSRIPPAKSEIWNPYQQAVSNIGNRPVTGPSGPTDVAGLEGERVQTSALNRELKSKMPNPEAVQLAQQKGMGQAQLLEHERNIKSALDPELASTGIKPGATRATYGGVAKVGERVSGRSTVGEESQPYGFGKLRNLDITKPLQAIPTIFDAGRDVVAGRPLFSGKPTDVAVRDAFRYGGPKPDLGKLAPPNLATARPLGLPAPAIGLGSGPQPGGTPAGYRPPPFYHDTTAMRTGRLLPAPPIELGGRVEGTPPPPFYHDTTPMRQGRLLPEPSEDLPVSSHSDIFPEQRPGSALLRRKGKR